ncbi:hypothetical protein G6F43_010359 [Rhizopus delemar]|nr:hypothetical protein G6F43_010359 [Rhizopus delemar]
MNSILDTCATVNAIWSPANQDTFVLPSVAPMFPYPSSIWMPNICSFSNQTHLIHMTHDGTIHSDLSPITTRQTDTGHLQAAKHPSEQTDEGTSEHDDIPSTAENQDDSPSLSQKHSEGLKDKAYVPQKRQSIWCYRSSKKSSWVAFDLKHPTCLDKKIRSGKLEANQVPSISNIRLFCRIEKAQFDFLGLSLSLFMIVWLDTQQIKRAHCSMWRL